MIDKMIIKDLVKQAVPDICAMRRHIHENPELSGEEVETAAFMAAKLRSFGIDVQEHVAGTTAVLGTLKGKAGTGHRLAGRYGRPAYDGRNGPALCVQFPRQDARLRP